MAKNIDSRIMHKHDTEENWKKAVNFIPKSGELIIYDADENHPFPRTKIGNGISKINELPFSSFSIENYRKTVSQENSMLRLSDISSDSHKVDIKLRSKNLFVTKNGTHLFGDVNNTTIAFNNGHIEWTTNRKEMYSLQSLFARYTPTIGEGTYHIQFSNFSAGTSTELTDFVIVATLYVINDDGTFTSTNLSLKLSKNEGATFTVDKDTEAAFSFYWWNGTGAQITASFDVMLTEGPDIVDFIPSVPNDTEITLTTCGKNLFDVDAMAEDLISKRPTGFALEEFDGRRCLKFLSSVNGYKYSLEGMGAQGLRCSVYTKGNTASIMGVRYDNNTTAWVGSSAVGTWKDISLYFSDKAMVRLDIYSSATEETAVYLDLDSFMIEESSTPTTYEPYKEGETITTTLAEGAALASIYPNMSIISNVQGVVIEATYNSIHFDEKWNGLINSAVDSISNSDIDRLFQ